MAVVCAGVPHRHKFEDVEGRALLGGDRKEGKLQEEPGMVSVVEEW